MHIPVLWHPVEAGQLLLEVGQRAHVAHAVETAEGAARLAYFPASLSHGMAALPTACNNPTTTRSALSTTTTTTTPSIAIYATTIFLKLRWHFVHGNCQAI